MSKKLGTVVAVLMAAGSMAGAQTNTFSTGTTFTTPGITGFATRGSEMAGMMVSWRFVGDATVYSSAWGNLGGTYYGVSVGGFRLRMLGAGDTFDSNWELTNTSTQRLEGIRLQGAPGRTLFDCGWTVNGCDNTGDGNTSGTTGSASGYSHTRTGGNFDGTVLGTYTNSVGVGANPDVGDLFESLLITFVGGTFGMSEGRTYDFRADTDSSPSGAEVPMPAVPEPSTYLLMGTGLVGLLSIRRKRKA